MLLAEDDREVRKLTRTVLEDFGYKVIEAEDGEEAVKEFRDNSGTVDMLLLDIMMPKKNGKEAYQEIKADAARHQGPVHERLYGRDRPEKRYSGTGLDFILKPISPTDLLRKVREVLDKKNVVRSSAVLEHKLTVSVNKLYNIHCRVSSAENAEKICNFKALPLGSLCTYLYEPSLVAKFYFLRLHQSPEFAFPSPVISPNRLPASETLRTSCPPL